MITATQRTELDHRILLTLSQFGQGVKAAALAECLQTTKRNVVGRLQALKHQEMVVYERNGSTPSAPGLWSVSQQGRQVTNQMATASQEKSTSR